MGRTLRVFGDGEESSTVLPLQGRPPRTDEVPGSLSPGPFDLPSDQNPNRQIIVSLNSPTRTPSLCTVSVPSRKNSTSLPPIPHYVSRPVEVFPYNTGTRTSVSVPVCRVGPGPRDRQFPDLCHFDFYRSSSVLGPPLPHQTSRVHLLPRGPRDVRRAPERPRRALTSRLRGGFYRSSPARTMSKPLGPAGLAQGQIVPYSEPSADPDPRGTPRDLGRGTLGGSCSYSSLLEYSTLGVSQGT